MLIVELANKPEPCLIQEAEATLLWRDDDFIHSSGFVVQPYVKFSSSS